MRPTAWTALLLFLVSLALPGCRSTSGAAAATGAGLAECPVCKHEGDLACICVRVDDATPRCECDGRTYYFCSDECRADFQHHPERYAPR